MARKIRFRAWDVLEKRFSSLEDKYQGHYSMSLAGRFTNLQNGSGGDEYVVQEFADVVDSDGKDVYEGDIVKFTPAGCSNPLGYAEIVWESNLNAVKSPQWCLRFVSPNIGLISDLRGKMEIVGNIFEYGFEKIKNLQKQEGNFE